MYFGKSCITRPFIFGTNRTVNITFHTIRTVGADMMVAFRRQLFTCYAILLQVDGNAVLKRDKKPHSTGRRSQYALKLKTKRRES